MVQIKDLVPKQGNVDITLDITEVGESREFAKFGKPGRVATAMGKDETGTVKVTLWNEQIDQIKAGDKIEIKNGYVSEWQGEKQLTTGRNGTLSVTSSSTEEATSEKPETPSAPSVKEETIE